MKQFERIYIEITNVCNLSCSFCPPSVRDTKYMSVLDFKKIALQCEKLTDKVFLHVMGEPLGHPQLFYILEIIKKLDLKVEITTNGTLLTKEIKKLLFGHEIRQINFSLQVFEDNNLSDSLNYLGNILNFTKELHEINSQTYINLRLWNTDVESNYFFLDEIDRFYNTKINRRLEIGAIKSKRVWERVYLHFDQRFEWPNILNSQNENRGYCHGLINQLAILVDGTVVPCCLDKDGVINLGNCHQSTINNILLTNRAKEIRNGFINGLAKELLCKHCTYIRRFDNKLKLEKS